MLIFSAKMLKYRKFKKAKISNKIYISNNKHYLLSFIEKRILHVIAYGRK
jgi:predicted transcriptional regulator